MSKVVELLKQLIDQIEITEAENIRLKKLLKGSTGSPIFQPKIQMTSQEIHEEEQELPETKISEEKPNNNLLF